MLSTVFVIVPTTICPWFDVDQQTPLRVLRHEARSLALGEWTATALRLWRRNMDRRMIGLFLHGTRTHAPQPSTAGVRGHAGCMQGPVCQFVQSCSIRTAHSSISIAPGDPRFKPSCDIWPAATPTFTARSPQRAALSTARTSDPTLR